ncbi:MAG: DUF5958 family protein [Proteobacteria bacterium]|nr:DUF5958 family protein [Pseudomonadota bacterium]
MNEIQIKLNKIAQDIITLDSGIVWFESYEKNEKLQILHFIALMISQSHPRPEEVDIALKQSGLKETFTPCVLVREKTLKEALTGILELPENEYRKSFILCINIFKVADERRRNTECKNGCSHWWHNLNRL